MSHDMKTVQFPRNNTKHLPFTIVDDSGDTVVLTDATIEWELRKQWDDDPVLSLGDDGVSIENREDLQGSFEIHLSADVTKNMRPRSYRETLRIEDANGNVSSWQGTVSLERDT